MTDVNPTSVAISKIRSTQTSLLISSRSFGAAAGKTPDKPGDGPARHLA